MRDHFRHIPILFRDRLCRSGKFSRGIAVAVLVLTSAGIAQADVAQAGAGTALRCYDFQATNNQTNRKLTDIHFVFPGGSWPSHVRTPASWDATLGPGGALNFTTPPTAPPAGSTVTKNPIDPGKSLDGFRFCLPGPAQGVRISVTFDVGRPLPPVLVQGGVAGSTAIRNSYLLCATLRITAPDAAVSDIHFGRLAGASEPHFDDVSAPGWSVNATEDEVTIDAGSGTPIPPGGTKDVDVCVRTKTATTKSATIEYYLTDKDHKEIPNTKGQLTTKK